MSKILVEINNNQYSLTIDVMSEILRRSIGLENTEFLNKIKGSNSRTIKR